MSSRLASTLDECGDEVKQSGNESIRCIRRTADGKAGHKIASAVRRELLKGGWMDWRMDKPPNRTK